MSTETDAQNALAASVSAAASATTAAEAATEAVEAFGDVSASATAASASAAAASTSAAAAASDASTRLVEDDANPASTFRVQQDARHKTAYGFFVNVKAPPFNAVGDGVADDTAAIQAAITAASTAGRPGVVWFPSNAGPGAYAISSTLTVNTPGVVLASPARSTATSGARLKWIGAAGGTILALDGERIQVSNLGFDGNLSAATLISCTSKRGVQLVNVMGKGWTGNNGATPGAGLMIGNGGANLNEFHSTGLHLQGSVAGAVGMVINATSTELVRFDNTLLNVSPANSGLSSWVITNCPTTFNGLTMDDGAMTDYAIRSTAGEIQLLGLASECPKLLWTAAVGRKGISVIEGQARSLSPGVGEYAVLLQGVGHFKIEGTRFQRKAAASGGGVTPPDVYIGTSVLGVTEEAVLWESADAAAVGTYVGSPEKVISIERSRGVVDSLIRPACWKTPDHSSRTTTAATLNRCIYVPIRIRKRTTFDRIACEVTTGVASAITRLGLYRSANGLPSLATYRTINLDSSVAGEVGETFATPLVVEPGLYFLASVAQVAAATHRTSAAYSESVGTDALIGSVAATAFYETSITSALPSTAAPTVETATAPIVGLRAV